MLTKKDWSVDDIVLQLRRMARACSNPSNDGFTARGIKEDLTKIKFLLEDFLDTTPTFPGEEEWYHTRMLKKLGKQDEDSSSK